MPTRALSAAIGLTSTPTSTGVRRSACEAAGGEAPAGRIPKPPSSAAQRQRPHQTRREGSNRKQALYLNKKGLRVVEESGWREPHGIQEETAAPSNAAISRTSRFPRTR